MSIELESESHLFSVFGCLEKTMFTRLFGMSWLARATLVCLVAGLTTTGVSPAFGQHGHGGGGHGGGGHGGGHSGGHMGGHSGGGHVGHSGHSGMHSGGVSHHSGHSGHSGHYGVYSGYGGYGGYGGLGIGGIGYSGFGYGFGSPIGYGSSRLGYSNYGYSNYGYNGYSAARPVYSTYVTPTYVNPTYVTPNYSTPYVVSRPAVVASPTMQETSSNVYTGGVAADGSPTGDLRPGMVLPDGSIVVSVGSAK
jgi:hypothetical protein